MIQNAAFVCRRVYAKANDNFLWHLGGMSAATLPDALLGAGMNRAFASRVYGGTYRAIPEDALPSQIDYEPFIWHTGNECSTPTAKGPEPAGKWMLFYHNLADLDDAWRRAKALCEAGELPGVAPMKVSTAYRNPIMDQRAGDGVLILYAGSEEAAEETVAIGRTIVQKMQYRGLGRNGRYMYWKSDKKTHEGVYSHRGHQGVSSFKVPAYQGPDAGLPSETTSRRWLRHPGSSGQTPEAGGKWVLCYSDMQQLDDAWQQAKALYDAGELSGVCSMLASTAAGNTNHHTRSAASSSSPSKGDQPNAGVILMHTGCDQGSEQVLAAGGNIVRKMKYTATAPFMYWKPMDQAAAAGSGSKSNAGAETRLKVPVYHQDV